MIRRLRWRPAVRRSTVLTVLLLVLGSLAVPAPQAARGQILADDGTGASSAVTVRGKNLFPEDFSNLEITVSQTRDLVNQAVVVTWTGGTPTPRNRPLGVDFLQIMQCYGDPFAADDKDGLKFRETCQFGSKLDTPVMPFEINAAAAANANSREIRFDAPGYPAADEGEQLPADARMVPFRPVSCPVGATACDPSRTPDGSASSPFPNIKDPQTGADREAYTEEVLAPYYGRAMTNEYPFALTAEDGTGRISFEVQNSSLAPDLGCGEPYRDATGVEQKSRPCWLVVVPRGHHHSYTGEDVSLTGSPQGSPLIPSLWRHRIVVPLEFEPAAGSCPLDRAERLTAGTELAAEAASSWRPALCAESAGGVSVSYSPIGDFQAAREILSPSPNAPGLIYSSDPVPTTASDPPLVHAPVMLSGLVLAMNIDVNLEDGPLPPEVARLRGTALSDLKLTPRLVAKLLTQSYQRDVPGNGGKALAKNYRSIKEDPEFLDLNPVFRSWDRRVSVTINGLMAPNGSSVAARALWTWILSDRAAANWLGGMPDGEMVVNPAYIPLFKGEVPDYFPQADRSCFQQVHQGETYELCSSELRPRTGGFGRGAAQTLRGDTGAYAQFLNVNVTPPKFEKLPREQPGFRFTMSVTDSASAARYGLFTAQLCKAEKGAGNTYVATDCRGATKEAISAAAGTAVPSAVQGVSVIDPARAWSAAGAYPLSLLTYAVADTTDPVDARRDYAKLLRYAVGEGQRPGVTRGLLPEGYVPLPTAMREQTSAAAKRLEEAVAPTAIPTPSDNSVTPPPAPALPSAVPAPASVPSAGAVPSPGAQAPSPQPTPKQASQLTQGSPPGGIRWVLLGVLVVGLVGGVAGPILRRFGTRYLPTNVAE
ncbi:hypothetical protein ABZ807_22115 [Micromonospora sp. NPDC047548]|uniref:hypothetical protein n=1 Tax=Micromonospora sp. NPDC047548 TaxID=3155624 RepID=UPI00340F4642